MKVADRVKHGIPDILICVSGLFVALELKRSAKEKATRLQQHTLDKIKDAGGSAWTANPQNWEAIKAELIKASEWPK